MAIFLYTGLQGSGKSYEVVSNPILEAVAAGRRVVTNIDGVNSSAIRAYLVKTRKMLVDDLGFVDHCTNEDVEKEDFYPSYEKEGFVKSGDLVAIDEAWRFYGTGKTVPKSHEVFFREHRHFVDEETKVSCDIVLITQTPTDLSRFVKNVVETSFQMTKLKTLGLSRNYRVDCYEGSQQKIARRVNTWQRRYKKEMFELYSSYSGGKGNEKTIDSRQNVLKDPRNWLYLFGIIVLLFGSFYALSFLKNKYSPDQKKEVEVSQRIEAEKISTVKKGAEPEKPKEKVYSQTDRLAGSIVSRNGTYQVIQTESGALRMMSVLDFNMIGYARFGEIEGKIIDYASGHTGTTQGISEAMK